MKTQKVSKLEPDQGMTPQKAIQLIVREGAGCLITDAGPGSSGVSWMSNDDLRDLRDGDEIDSIYWLSPSELPEVVRDLLADEREFREINADDGATLWRVAELPSTSFHNHTTYFILWEI